MISDTARRGFDQAFMQALAPSLAAPGGPPCTVKPLDGAVPSVHEKVVLLTVSSYGFRLMTLLHFRLDAPGRAHLARLGRVEGELDDAAALDVIAECGNICCGALNRSLGGVFPHTGMSTPNVLNARSGDFLTALGPAHLRHFEVRIDDGGPVWHASLCVCTDSDIDFTLTAAVAEAEAAQETGELEMF